MTLKFGISTVCRAVLVVGMLFLLLAVEDVSARWGVKRQGTTSKGSGGRGRVKTVKLQLDPNLGPFSPSTYPLQNMSLSPWVYTQTDEESRVPRKIFEARCLKTGCLSDERGAEDMGLESKPISYQILVLRRVKGKKKNYSYKLEAKTIHVGCTCVLPKVIPEK